MYWCYLYIIGSVWLQNPKSTRWVECTAKRMPIRMRTVSLNHRLIRAKINLYILNDLTRWIPDRRTYRCWRCRKPVRRPSSVGIPFWPLPSGSNRFRKVESIHPCRTIHGSRATWNRARWIVGVALISSGRRNGIGPRCPRCHGSCRRHGPLSARIAGSAG